MTERQSMLDGLNIQHCSYLFWDFMACSALKIAAVENGKKGNAEPLPFPLRFPSSLRRDAVVVSDPAKD